MKREWADTARSPNVEQIPAASYSAVGFTRLLSANIGPSVGSTSHLSLEWGHCANERWPHFYLQPHLTTRQVFAVLNLTRKGQGRAVLTSCGWLCGAM